MDTVQDNQRKESADAEAGACDNDCCNCCFWWMCDRWEYWGTNNITHKLLLTLTFAHRWSVCHAVVGTLILLLYCLLLGLYGSTAGVWVIVCMPLTCMFPLLNSAIGFYIVYLGRKWSETHMTSTNPYWRMTFRWHNSCVVELLFIVAGLVAIIITFVTSSNGWSSGQKAIYVMLILSNILCFVVCFICCAPCGNTCQVCRYPWSQTDRSGSDRDAFQIANNDPRGFSYNTFPNR